MFITLFKKFKFVSATCFLSQICSRKPSILVQVDDWRDIAYPKDASRPSRIRTLGANCVVSGFGFEYDALGSSDTVSSAR